MIKKELEVVLAKHKVEMFEFRQLSDHEYILKTDKPATPELMVEFRQAADPFMVFFGTLPEPEQPVLPGFPPSQVNNHPSQYNSGKIEVIEFIEDQGFGPGMWRGTAIKYAARAGTKDPTKEIEDLEKAVWYLKREIEVKTAQKLKREFIRPNGMNAKDFKTPGYVTAEMAVRANLHRVVGEWIDAETEDGTKTVFMPVEVPVGLELEKRAYILIDNKQLMKEETSK